jgi:hypothetical protein
VTPDSQTRNANQVPLDNERGQGPAQEAISQDDRTTRFQNSTNIETGINANGSNGNGGNRRKRQFDGPEGPGGGNPPGPGDHDDGVAGTNSESGRTPLIDFREEQKELHIIANYPGKIALLSDSWAGHFKGFPIPRGLFYRQVSNRRYRPRIYEHTPGQDYHGKKSNFPIRMTFQ